MSSEEEQAWRAAGWTFSAYSIPGSVVLTPGAGALLDRMVASRDAGRATDPWMPMILLHEALHQLRGAPACRDEGEAFEVSRMLEEGLVDAVAADLLPNFIARAFGPKSALLLRGGVQGTISYPDQVTEVRRRSMRATGKPWHSPGAFAWRVGMLRKTLQERAVEWERVGGLAMPHVA